MQRGIISLSKGELNSLLGVFDVEKYSHLHISNKLKAGMSSIEELIPFEVSEDELEILSDEFSVPTPDDSDELKSVRMKISSLMMKFRDPIGSKVVN